MPFSATWVSEGNVPNTIWLQKVPAEPVSSTSDVTKQGGGGRGRLVGMAAENPRETKRCVTHINVFKLGETSCTASGVVYLIT